MKAKEQMEQELQNKENLQTVQGEIKDLTGEISQKKEELALAAKAAITLQNQTDQIKENLQTIQLSLTELTEESRQKEEELALAAKAAITLQNQTDQIKENLQTVQRDLTELTEKSRQEEKLSQTDTSQLETRSAKTEITTAEDPAQKKNEKLSQTDTRQLETRSAKTEITTAEDPAQKKNEKLSQTDTRQLEARSAKTEITTAEDPAQKEEGPADSSHHVIIEKSSYRALYFDPDRRTDKAQIKKALEMGDRLLLSLNEREMEDLRKMQAIDPEQIPDIKITPWLLPYMTKDQIQALSPEQIYSLAFSLKETGKREYLSYLQILKFLEKSRDYKAFAKRFQILASDPGPWLRDVLSQIIAKNHSDLRVPLEQFGSDNLLSALPVDSWPEKIIKNLESRGLLNGLPAKEPSLAINSEGQLQEELRQPPKSSEAEEPVFASEDERFAVAEKADEIAGSLNELPESLSGSMREDLLTAQNIYEIAMSENPIKKQELERLQKKLEELASYLGPINSHSAREAPPNSLPAKTWDDLLDNPSALRPWTFYPVQFINSPDIRRVVFHPDIVHRFFDGKNAKGYNEKLANTLLKAIQKGYGKTSTTGIKRLIDTSRPKANNFLEVKNLSSKGYFRLVGFAHEDIIFLIAFNTAVDNKKSQQQANNIKGSYKQYLEQLNQISQAI